MPSPQPQPTLQAARQRTATARAAAAADGRTYLSWVLVYTFAKVAGIQIQRMADARTLDAVVAAGFDPWTRNEGHDAERVTATEQIRTFRARTITE